MGNWHHCGCKCPPLPLRPCVFSKSWSKFRTASGRITLKCHKNSIAKENKYQKADRTAIPESSCSASRGSIRKNATGVAFPLQSRSREPRVSALSPLQPPGSSHCGYYTALHQGQTGWHVCNDFRVSCQWKPGGTVRATWSSTSWCRSRLVPVTPLQPRHTWNPSNILKSWAPHSPQRRLFNRGWRREWL